MIIYTSERVLPYIYICTHKITGEFYIGYRHSNKTPSHLDFPKYKTSSKYVKPRFEEFTWVIVAEFFDVSSAFWFEQDLIKENFNNPKILNKQYKNRENQKQIFGGIWSLENKLKQSNYMKGRPAWNKGISTSWCKGLTKDTDERLLNISKNVSTRMKNNVPWNKGKTLTKQQKASMGRYQRTVEHNIKNSLSQKAKAKRYNFISNSCLYCNMSIPEFAILLNLKEDISRYHFKKYGMYKQFSIMLASQC